MSIEVNYFKKYLEVSKENKELKLALKALSNKFSMLERNYKQLEESYEKYKKEEESRIEAVVAKVVKETTEKVSKEYENKIFELNNKITKLEARLNVDSSNSGIPTSKEPINRKRMESNTREPSDKHIGGQPGHKQHKLEYFKEEEITETKEHTLESCPHCGGELKEENVVISDIIDFNIEVKKIRNKINNYVCIECKKRVSANKELPRGVGYGTGVKAMCLDLLNSCNVPYNKIESHISGITNGEVNVSAGYIAKLQKQASSLLEDFNKDLKTTILNLDVVHWDDGVIKLGVDDEELEKQVGNTESSSEENSNDKKKKKVKQGIMRFYGDDNYALLIAHKDKSEDGIIEDGILPNLPSTCTCVHDHVLLNYNEKFDFDNAECNQHALKYLKRVTDNIYEETWPKKMAKLLRDANKKVKENISKNIFSFSDDEIKAVYEEYQNIIKLGYEENGKVPDYHDYKSDELNLIKRLEKFKDNHLLFIKNHHIPFTNNTAEKGIRLCKRKMAISFMFKNLIRAQDYGKITSYIETCYRHGISKYQSLVRLLSGNPYSIEELKKLNKNENQQ